MTRKNSKKIYAFWTKAKPRAGPNKGAEQGVAKKTANKPEKKADKYPEDVFGMRDIAHWGVGTWKTPNNP